MLNGTIYHCCYTILDIHGSDLGYYGFLILFSRYFVAFLSWGFVSLPGSQHAFFTAS